LERLERWGKLKGMKTVKRFGRVWLGREQKLGTVDRVWGISFPWT
jgi:hypothetical protein